VDGCHRQYQNELVRRDKAATQKRTYRVNVTQEDRARVLAWLASHTGQITVNEIAQSVLGDSTRKYFQVIAVILREAGFVRRRASIGGKRAWVYRKSLTIAVENGDCVDLVVLTPAEIRERVLAFVENPPAGLQSRKSCISSREIAVYALDAQPDGIRAAQIVIAPILIEAGLHRRTVTVPGGRVPFYCAAHRFEHIRL
jgi:hypothetical protein